jgi:5-methylcytosine-specific restriction endonuclease McrA
MGSQVLVVNTSYMPVNSVSWQNAIGLVYTGKAETIVEDENEVLRSPSISINKPIVIRLLGYNKLPNISMKFNKRNILLRDNYTCQYCGKKLHSKELTLDHVKPRKLGGKTNWENIVTCCKDCNSKKSEYLLHQTNMNLLSEPKKPYYTPALLIRKCASKEDLKKWDKFFII